MKKLTIVSVAINLLVVGVLLFALLFGRGIVKNIFVSQVMQPKIERSASMFEVTPVQTGAIIFLGNSITEGVNWQEFFPGKLVLNRGIGGDITLGVLARINEVTRHQPKALFICIGTNDLAFELSVDSIITNYNAIIKTVQQQSPATKIYVQSVLPVGPSVIYGHNNEGVLKLNEAIQAMCTQMQLPYLNVHDLFVNEAGYLDNSYSNDNLHLMGNAYQKWTDFLQPYVAEIETGADSLNTPADFVE